MQNQSKKTIEEKRLEARRALEGEERGRRRKEEEERITEEKLREEELVEKKKEAENERRKLKEKQKKDAIEKERKEKERRNREATEKEEEGQKEEERKNKQKEEEEKMNREALLMQMRPPGKKLRPLSKETRIPKKNGAGVPHIKTYRNDATKAIKKQGESLTKILLAEKKKKEEKTPPIKTSKIYVESTPKKTANKIIIITGLIIMGISSGAFVYLYQNNKKEISSATPKATEVEIPAITITPAVVRSLVIADTEKNIDVSAGNNAVLNTIAKELEETTGTDSIKNIYFTKNTTVSTKKGTSGVQQNPEIKKLLSVWSNKMPALLSRSLSNEFMLGIYSSNPGRNMPFLILTTNSYEQTFAGMFKWENNILSDFYKLFGISTKQTTQSFRDYVIRGNDVRILKNQTGETLMLYSFINKDMLVITTNEEVLNKILFRLK